MGPSLVLSGLQFKAACPPDFLPSQQGPHQGTWRLLCLDRGFYDCWLFPVISMCLLMGGAAEALHHTGWGGEGGCT